MKRRREKQAARPEWTREQLEAAQWTPEQLREARERWERGKPQPPGKTKTDV